MDHENPGPEDNVKIEQEAMSEDVGENVESGIEHLWQMEKPGPKLKPGSRRWLQRFKTL